MTSFTVWFVKESVKRGVKKSVKRGLGRRALPTPHSPLIHYLFGQTVPCTRGTEPMPLYTNFCTRFPSYVSVV